ncbi:MAG: small, acid-soluble spore protein, alpha/beta type [Bacilli bacterium]|nr:small, acid-soluble spore protein, alpha/beta type [Bacilli bacterium]MDD4608331.1 small, acid-soluble spore protein, alpha/beta type [Bacilli bacterium]
MSKSIMSENLKREIASQLDVSNIVENEGWGSVSSRNCGNMVKKAIEIANGTYK